MALDLSDFVVPTLVMPKLKSVNPAEWMHERLVESINTFEEGLNQDQELGARLVSFGSEMTFHIEDVSYWGPDMIMFYGTGSNGKKVQLIQHYSQLSVLLVATDKIAAEARRIGFKLKKKLEESKAEEGAED